MTDKDKPNAEISFTPENAEISFTPEVVLIDEEEEEKKSSKKLEELQEETKAYDIAKSQEKTRAWLARGLFLLLAITYIGCVSSFLYYTFKSENKDDETAIKDFMTLVISSQTTLVGTALGFYFGAKT